MSKKKVKSKKGKRVTGAPTAKSKISKSKSPKKPVATSTPNLAASLLEDEPGNITHSKDMTPNLQQRLVCLQEAKAEHRRRGEDLSDQATRAEQVSKRLIQQIKKGLFGAVSGCSVCLLEKDGVLVSPLQYVVEIHVKNKVSDVKLKRYNPNRKTPPKPDQIQKIPRQLTDIRIKVIEADRYCTVITSGLVKAKHKSDLQDIRVEPVAMEQTEILGGLPIVQENQLNNPQPGWGTLGIAFSNRKNESSQTTRYFGIANAHFTDPGQSVFQPDVQPGVPTGWAIGKVKTNTEQEDDAGFFVDAALIELNKDRQVISRLVQEFGNERFLFAGRPLNSRQDRNIKVFKFGARTAKRLEGKVTDPTFTDFSSGVVISAKGLDRGFTKQGDSGSVLVAPVLDTEGPDNPDTQRKQHRFLVVGLCYGGDFNDSKRLYACHFSQVILALNLKIPKSFIRSKWSY